MIRYFKQILLLAVFLLTGCAMFSAWHRIPAPEGCSECHQTSINADWQVLYKPVDLNDETGKLSWQQPSSVEPEPAPQEQRELTNQACFKCHRSPDKEHKKYQGSYRHRQ
jgi:hypothetical protein